MHYSLLKFTFVLNFVLIYWKLLIFEFLLGIRETFLCSMAAVEVKIVHLLDVLQLLMLFAGTLTYLEPEMFPFCNGNFLIIRISTDKWIYIYVYTHTKTYTHILLITQWRDFTN
jgi:hypothetical protein